MIASAAASVFALVWLSILALTITYLAANQIRSAYERGYRDGRRTRR